MPTESALPAEADLNADSRHAQPASGPIKCSVCGIGSLATGVRMTEEVPEQEEESYERVCGNCVGSLDSRRNLNVLGLGIDVPREDARREELQETESPESEGETSRNGRIRETARNIIEPVPIPQLTSPSPVLLHSQSLPSQPTRPWTTAIPPTVPESPASPEPSQALEDEPNVPPNPLLDVTKSRMPSVGRGALYPGSIFKGTQTSGRSAYEVEVRILDVNFPESSLSGYLSISHLTDAHPHLTTFFTGEIIGSKHGFITGAKYGATEHDDMRHWGRFEQFRRPSTRADMVRPELFFRDPVPDRTRGETKAKERDFVFLRIKERFLVPDHTVRDISGASFAGFYFAMVDLAPAADAQPPASPTSPTTKFIPTTTPTSPTLPRRMSSTGDARPARPELARRRQSSNKFVDPTPSRGEATIRGYYFHSLNQEPFQELFLTHVPSRSSSTMELR